MGQSVAVYKAILLVQISLENFEAFILYERL